MATFVTHRLATPDETAAEMDRRGAVIEQLETDLRHWREECGKLHSQVDRLRNSHTALVEALRNIAEGNLGDAPWQANYDKIREVALRALSAEGEKDAPKDDGWIEWKGGECPVGPDVDVDARFRSGGDGNDLARYYRWDHLGQDNDIVAYRVVKP